MRKKNLMEILILGIFVILFFIMPIFLIDYFNSFFQDMSDFKNFILQFEFFSVLILILFVVLQVIFSPLPGQFFGMVSGYIYGTYLGTFYSLIGLIIGSTIVFFISKRFGRKLVEKVVSKKYLNKFDSFSDDKRDIFLFLVFLFPFLPDDMICYFAGLTKISYRRFILISILGRLPGYFALNLIGSSVYYNDLMQTYFLISVIAVISLVMFFYRKMIEKKVMFIVMFLTEKYSKREAFDRK